MTDPMTLVAAPTPAYLWADQQVVCLAEEMGRKKRLDVLRREAGDYAAVLAAFIFIARRKASAHAAASSGAIVDTFNWMHRDQSLAQAVACVQTTFIPVQEIPMLPSGVVADREQPAHVADLCIGQQGLFQ